MNEHKYRRMMKLKINLIAGIIIVFFLFGGTLRAQGIYSTNNQTTTTPASNGAGGGIYRDLGDGGGTTGDGDPAAGDDDPIGEGFFILSLLAGGYALVKRNLKNKHED